MFKTSFAGDFIEKIKARSQEWASSPKLTYTINLPPGMEWVMYQEFGIDHAYTITGPKGIDFPSDIYPGVILHAEEVTHPGLHPTHTIGIVNESMMNGPLQAAVTHAFSSADYAIEIVKLNLEEYMETVKQQIADDMLETLPGTREAPIPGKLHGRSASEVFFENATVVLKD